MRLALELINFNLDYDTITSPIWHNMGEVIVS